MPPALVAFQALQIGSPLRHETRAASPDARAAPPRLPMVLGRVRALFASPAGGIRVADYSLGAVGLVQPNSPIGALHQVRRQRRNPAAPVLGRHGSGVGAVPARISCKDGRYLPSWLFVDREPVRKLEGVVIPAPGALIFIARHCYGPAPITP